MKLSIWDILSVVIILSTLCLCGLFGFVLFDQNNSLNPFPPPTRQPTVFIVIPTTTPTLRSLPPTWTYTPGPDDTQGPEETILRPSSTPLPTFTSFVIASFTPSVTPTNTSTVTPTVTITPTPTQIPSLTPVTPTVTLTP